MIDTISLVSGNPEPMHEALRDVMCSLHILDFAVQVAALADDSATSQIG
jgi:hypothetical protein